MVEITEISSMNRGVGSRVTSWAVWKKLSGKATGAKRVKGQGGVFQGQEERIKEGVTQRGLTKGVGRTHLGVKRGGRNRERGVADKQSARRHAAPSVLDRRKQKREEIRTRECA